MSSLDKVLFPETGFTKAQLIDYYVRVAPMMLAHVGDRPLTIKRYPHGVSDKFFYQKHVPPGAPNWVRTITVPHSKGNGSIDFTVVDDLPSLVWITNLQAIELHVPLWHIGRRRRLPGPPDHLVFDLDPGEGASIVECSSVARMIEPFLREMGLKPRAKTSGSKGLQLYAQLNGRTTWETSKSKARDIARHLEAEHRELVTANMSKALRRGRVLIDWSQNSPSKTTVCAYSVRGLPRQTVSTPVTWDEVRRCERKGDAALLEFTTDQVLSRIKKFGDLFAAE